MARDKYNPLSGYGLGACVFKFLGAAFFGVLVDIPVFWIIVLVSDRDFALWESSTVWSLLLAIPVGWGIAGIFSFDHMLDLGRKIFEGFYFSRRGR